MSSKYFLAAETKYTILVSTVTASVASYSPIGHQLQHLVKQMRGDDDLTKKLSVGRISKDTTAAEGH
jgi:hypothetical protein